MKSTVDLSDNPVLWQRTPHEIASSIFTDEAFTKEAARTAVADVIKVEREAAKRYVQSCTDALWADTPGVQESVHSITLNGVDIKAVCVGFSTAEQWAELLITAGSYPNGSPRMILNSQHMPLTVRVLGDVQVVMTGTLNGVLQFAHYEAAR